MGRRPGGGPRVMGAQAHWLPDGRLHLHHGPTDAIVQIDGPADAYSAAVRAFDGMLDTLVKELPLLREPVGPSVHGPVAQRMVAATAPWSEVFVTPMAAVAGAIADALLDAITKVPGVRKAVVNNGGDIAFALSPGQSFTALGAAGQITLTSADGAGGVATSGWGGRSHSRGIADAVTVVARTAAEADVAATLIANAVDLPGHPAITRTPARALSPDSDLGERFVTTGVGPLTANEVDAALARGLAVADHAGDRILGATLLLQGKVRATERQKEATDA